MANQGDIFERSREVRGVFSPRKPIAHQELFEGRAAQVLRVGDIVEEPGMHGVIYGERGVGKTSLATIAAQIFSRPDRFAVRINCTAADNFRAVWRRALGEVTYATTQNGIGFNPVPSPTQHRGSELLPQDFGPDDVRMTLRSLGQLGSFIFFFDEFDRIESLDARNEFADLIKTLSDHGLESTVILVGVADNVDELMAEHRSVERAVTQVDMPRLETTELASIVTKGLAIVGMTIQEDALNTITSLSQGLPHYTHLLAQEAADQAVWAERKIVNGGDVREAIKSAIERAQETVAEAYYAATRSNRENLYAEVLLACALADRDERGFFAAADVRMPLADVAGRNIDIPQFAAHLKAFCDDRGPVLKRSGTTKQFRYRFVNPLMAPHVIMRGITDGRIDVDMLAKYGAAAIARGR